MKPRIEQKLRVDPAELTQVLAWLGRSGGTLLHPDRTVTSTYFDSAGLLMFRHTEEGITPRKKVRIRCYQAHGPQCADRHRLEVKLTTEHGRLKEARDCPEWQRLQAGGLYDPDYGICRPQVIVSYVRSYFAVNEVRMTIDRHLTYRPVGATGAAQTIRDPGIAVEIKAPDGFDLDRLTNDFPTARIHFSKYERAIHAVRPHF